MVMNCSERRKYDAESITHNLIKLSLIYQFCITILKHGVLEGDRARRGMLMVLWQSQQWGAEGELSSVTTTRAGCAPPCFSSKW